MRREKNDRITATVLVMALLGMLTVSDLLIHWYAPDQVPEVITDEAENSGEKTANEIQYDELLWREQAITGEIERLKEEGGSEMSQEDKEMLIYLEDDLHRVQVSKKRLEAQMEEEAARK